MAREKGLPSTVAMAARVRVQDLVRAAVFVEKNGGPKIAARSSLVSIIVSAISSLAETEIPLPTLREAWDYLEERWPAQYGQAVSKQKQEVAARLGQALARGVAKEGATFSRLLQSRAEEELEEAQEEVLKAARAALGGHESEGPTSEVQQMNALGKLSQSQLEALLARADQEEEEG